VEDGDDSGELPPPKRSVIEATGLKMSAAGLCVHMGSFSDPPDIPGLAHFLGMEQLLAASLTSLLAHQF
jgi:nardilysin